MAKHLKRIHKGILGVLEITDLVTALAGEDAALDGCAIGNGLVRVHSLVGLLAVEVVLDQLLHLGNASGSAHQHNLVDVLL